MHPAIPAWDGSEVRTPAGSSSTPPRSTPVRTRSFRRSRGPTVQDLYPNKVLKKTWDQLLYAAGAATAAGEGLDSPAGPQSGVYAQEIHRAEAIGTATGEFPEDIEKWFAAKSTIINTSKITAPTMIIQGTVDTLFPLEDAFAHYAILKRNRVPVKLVTYCAGHTLGCSYPGGSSGYPEGEGSERPPLYEDRMLAWLDRYVKGLSTPTGAEIEWQAQDGFYYGAGRYPLPGTRVVETKPVETGTLVGPRTDRRRWTRGR
jgi:ABC-2 type transport system ATP-binding protein